MGVAIDEPGQQSSLPEVDHCDVPGRMRLNISPEADLFDSLAFRQDTLIEQVSSALNVQDPACSDQLRSRRRRRLKSHLSQR